MVLDGIRSHIKLGHLANSMLYNITQGLFKLIFNHFQTYLND